MNRLKMIVATGLTLAAFAASTATALANPKPPTNGGNGAGQSGQCTGPAADRPAPCPGG
jgi:hypothetical protein